MLRKFDDEFEESEFENMRSSKRKKKKNVENSADSANNKNISTRHDLKDKNDSANKLTHTLITVLIVLILCVLIAGIVYLYMMKQQDEVVSLATPTPTSTPVVEITPTPTSTPEPTFDISGYDTESFNSETVIVNKSHTLTANDIPDDQVYIDMPSTIANMTVKSVVNDALNELYQAASEAGVDLYVNQGYISYYYQHELFTSYQNTVGANGQAEMFVPDSGQSDYQTGYAVGFISLENGSYTRLNSSLRSNCALEQCEGSAAAIWLSENAYKYGFIQRYPEGKEEYTGFYGQWYTYRYVGKEVAQAMYESGECMEEFFHIDN